MKNVYYLIFVSLVFSLCFYACSENAILEEKIPTLPENNYNYQPDSDNLQRMFQRSPDLSDAKATLGRVLFYDTKLSGNHTIACASCHKQHLGFADGEAFSTGVNVTKTLRNSPSLANLFAYNGFFWDRRTWVLEELIFQPIEDHIEMRFSNEEALVNRLEETSYYPGLFEDAFGSTDIDKNKITEAMTDYLESMISIDSKFDQGLDLDIEFSNLSATEQMGRELFFGKATCSNCHGDGNLAKNGSTTNIGLDMEYTDQGAHSGRFKVPGLRNVALSAPYMHDGRFSTLEEVINHYNNDIQPHPSLSWILKDEGQNPIRLGLTASEVKHLEAFLHTLTDWTYIRDERFSDPF